MRSQLATGSVHHRRYREPQHEFRYNLHLLWLDLDELDELNSVWRKPWFWFKRQDYLGEGDLKAAVLAQIEQLSEGQVQLSPEQQSTQKVWLLGQYRSMGMYFSPINFYFLESDHELTHLLAEVSNTPWNERHYYWVPLQGEQAGRKHPKSFHVSPYLPMALTYQWHIRHQDNQLGIQIHCHDSGSEELTFIADLKMTMQPLSAQSMRQMWRQTPSMTLKGISAIYYEAFKLLFKRAKIYPHPKKL